MSIGVRAHDFGRHSPAGLVDAVGAAGFETVQLAMTKAIQGITAPDQVTPRLLQEVEEAFFERNLGISVLGCYIEPSLPDRQERLAQVRNFQLGLSHAKRLGVSVVGTETTRFDPDPANEPFREAAYQCLKDSVLRMAEEAEKQGVLIGIEPVADHVLNSADLTLRLLSEVDSDRIRIIFDPVNMILEHTAQEQERIYMDFLHKLGDRLVALHMKDIVFRSGEKVWRNIGAGIVRYEGIFQWLRQNKPHTPLLREHVKTDSYQVDIAAMRRLAEG